MLLPSHSSRASSPCLFLESHVFAGGSCTATIHLHSAGMQLMLTSLKENLNKMLMAPLSVQKEND